MKQITLLIIAGLVVAGLLFDAESNSTFIHFRSATAALRTHVLLEHDAHELGQATVAERRL